MPNELAGLVVLDVDRIRTCWWPIPRPGRQPSLDVLRPLQPLEADQGSCTKVWVPHFLESLGKRIGLLARCRLDFNAGVDALQTLERIRCVKKIGILALDYAPRLLGDVDGEIGRSVLLTFLT